MRYWEIKGRHADSKSSCLCCVLPAYLIILAHRYCEQHCFKQEIPLSLKRCKAIPEKQLLNFWSPEFLKSKRFSNLFLNTQPYKWSSDQRRLFLLLDICVYLRLNLKDNMDMWLTCWADRRPKFKHVNCLSDWIDHFIALWLSYHLPTKDIISGFPYFMGMMWKEMR